MCTNIEGTDNSLALSTFARLLAVVLCLENILTTSGEKKNTSHQLDPYYLFSTCNWIPQWKETRIKLYEYGRNSSLSLGNL